MKASTPLFPILWLALLSVAQAAEPSEAHFKQRRDAMIEGVRKNAPPGQLKNPGLAANLTLLDLFENKNIGEANRKVLDYCRGDHTINYGGKNYFHSRSDAILRIGLLEEISAAVKDQKPFFLYLSHYAVHGPALLDKRFSANYPNLKGIELPYATLVEGADKSLGDVMEHLGQLGIGGNTMVIWTADNGGLFDNAPLKGRKNDCLEGGHRVPTFAAWGEQNPSLVCQKRLPLAPGRIEDRPFIHQDWMPTLLALAELEHPDPARLDGFDITGLLAGKGGDIRPDLFFWHEPNFWKFSGPESAIREDRWKLIHFYESRTWELYDPSGDIGETTNLLGKHPEKAADLAAKLINHLKANHANYPTDVKSGEEQPPRYP